MVQDDEIQTPHEAKKCIGLGVDPSGECGSFRGRVARAPFEGCYGVDKRNRCQEWQHPLLRDMDILLRPLVRLFRNIQANFGRR